MADSLSFSTAELEAFLSGEKYTPPPAKPEPARHMPGMVEVDERPSFVDVLRAAHAGNSVRQKPEANSFVGFLARHYAEKRDNLKRLVSAK